MDINDGFMPSNVSNRFQSKLDMLKHSSDWNGIITMLKRYASKYPNEYYIYQQLAATYYIESIGKYQLALKCAENAFNMEPDDDLQELPPRMLMQLHTENMERDFFMPRH